MCGCVAVFITLSVCITLQQTRTVSEPYEERTMTGHGERGGGVISGCLVCLTNEGQGADILCGDR